MFWSELVPQLNIEGEISDHGMQFTHLHAFGRVVIVAHLFGWELEQGSNGNMPEDEIIRRVINVMVNLFTH